MRILILSASTGGGHMRTANAMKKYIEENRPDDVVQVVDTLERVGHLYNKTVSEGYELMVKAAPKFFGTVYNQTNKETPMNNWATKFQHILSKRLLPLMVEFRPDVMICVHAFCADMASCLKMKYKMDVPIICLITDFAIHKMYVQRGIDAYVVSNQEMVYALEAFGVDPHTVQVSGIPIDPVFYNPQNRVQLMKKMNLDPNLSTLLLMAGSFGVKDIFKIYREIVETEADFQIIVITGKNKKLFEAFSKMLDKDASYVEAIAEVPEENTEIELEEELEELDLYNLTEEEAELPEEAVSTEDTKETTYGEINRVYSGKYGKKPTKLLYFVNNIHEYMYISDLIITKPGGLTVSEAIASTLPMAIFSAFPGQEEDNAEYLQRNNMAVRLPKKNPGRTVHNLLLNTEKMAAMKEACRSNYRENSAGKIFELADRLVKSYRIKNKTYNAEEVSEMLIKNNFSGA